MNALLAVVLCAMLRLASPWVVGSSSPWPRAALHRMRGQGIPSRRASTTVTPAMAGVGSLYKLLPPSALAPSTPPLLIVVDGTALMFRSYYAMPPLTRPLDGLEVGLLGRRAACAAIEQPLVPSWHQRPKSGHLGRALAIPPRPRGRLVRVAAQRAAA